VFRSLREPAINAGGATAFVLTLGGPGVTPANNEAIALNSASQTFAIALTGDVAPDTTGTAAAGVFARLGDPVINNNEAVAFVGAVKTGGETGILPSEGIGIWSDASGLLKRVVRAGDAAPGVTGGVFTGFEQIVLPDNTDVEFRANFSAGRTKHGAGIWYSDGAGTLTPIAITGGTLGFHGVTKTISKIAIFQQPAIALGQSRSFDSATGALTFTASFTDRTWGIYRATLPRRGL
jgi:hypothetical protein